MEKYNPGNRTNHSIWTLDPPPDSFIPSRNQGATQRGLTNVYKTEIVQNLVHHEPQCLYTYVSAGVL